MQQRQSSRTRTRRRSTTRGSFSPSGLTMALSIGMVLILISVTFVADLFSTPEITLLSTTPLLSPNNDQDQDFANIGYQISDDAEVTAQVVSPSGGVVTTILLNEHQTAGQHSITWAGVNELGQTVPDGIYRLEITAQGTMRSSSQSINLTVDTTPPALQLANVPEGLRVRENSMTIQGVTDPDATVLVSGSNQPVIIDGSGTFSFIYRLVEGTNQMEVQAADQAGNTTKVRRRITLVTTPPEVEIATPLDNSWTNQTLTAVSGRISPGVELTINDQPVTIANDGTFFHQLILQEGDNLIRAAATDDVGNITLSEVLVHVKTTPPTLTLNVQEGEIFNDSILQLSGKTDPGSIATINGQVVPVGSTGTFQISLQLFEGDNILDLQVRDQAGNTTSLARRVRYQAGTANTALENFLSNFSFLPSLGLPALITGISLIAFMVFRQRGISLSLSVDQRTFRPGLPGEGKLLLIWMDMNRTTRVTLEVLDRNGYPVATILNDRRRTARRHTFAWDGYDDFGRPAPPGLYTIQAEAGVAPIKVTSGIQVRVGQDILAHGPSETAKISEGEAIELVDEVPLPIDGLDFTAAEVLDEPFQEIAPDREVLSDPVDERPRSQSEETQNHS